MGSPNPDKQLFNARIVTVVAGTFISLACGTNYAFSAWAPQFSTRMHFSSTEMNLIATFGNLGMYACGIPVGLMVDKRGPKPGILGGCVLVGLGYFMLHQTYDWGPHSTPLWLLCFYSFMTGLGGCMAFAGSVKTAAMNWPQHRGTATAFPLASFGLSAFFFASLARVLAPNDASKFLTILSLGGFLLIFVPSFFLRIIPATHGYKPITENRKAKRHRHGSSGSAKGLLHNRQRSEPDGSFLRRIAASSLPTTHGHAIEGSIEEEEEYDEEDSGDTTSPIISETQIAESAHKSIYPDVRGPQMLKYIEFYQYFLIMGILTGIGLMTINNIGNDAYALWAKFDPSVDIETIRHRQAVHVSILSVGSFLGRLISGIGSDVVVKTLGLSRIWCLFASCLLFVIAQVVGLALENPNFLVLLSGLTGAAYGFLFGCFPSTLAETFGISSLSTNWGILTLSPVLFANVFNIMYGRIFDSHSHAHQDHGLECHDGRFCYHEAYWGTFVASVAVSGITLWSIWHQHKVKQRIGWKGEGNEHLS